jgi:osmotically-inducible protein OsmY
MKRWLGLLLVLLLAAGGGSGCKLLEGRTLKERTKLQNLEAAKEAIDRAIKAAVMMSLASDPEFKLQLDRINVEVKNGVVVLTGTVETEEQKRRAGEIAASIKDVKKVINHLTVLGYKDRTTVLEEDY